MKKVEKEERTAVARQRSNAYGFLAAVYCQEITSDLLQQIKAPRFLGVLSELGLDLPGDFFQKSKEDLLDDLAVEYARLFLGPGRHISPHESVHHQQDDAQSGQLWGDSTVKVKKFIETTGLEYKTDYRGMPDHISVELEFMEQVIRREGQAWEEDDKGGAQYCLKIEKKFIDEHLIRWIPTFCERVINEAELPFYREMAALTRSFIEFEKEEMDNYLEGVPTDDAGEVSE